MNIQEIFLNSHNQLRSGWRFAIFLVLFWVMVLFILAASLLAIKQTQFSDEDKSLMLFIAGDISYVVSGLAFGWICGKFFEGLPLRALGISFSDYWIKHLLLGLIFGTFSMLLAVLIAVAFGGLNFENNTLAGSYAKAWTLGSAFLILLIGAAAEEILFRGYILQTFARANLAWFAVTMTALFFALVHLKNPNANWISSVNTGLAGIMFGAAYLKTRTLWFPFALHLMWNWIQGAIFGIPVSGITDLFVGSLLKPLDAGPTWLTGGAYGIEGGIACTIALVVTTAVIWLTPFLKPTEEMLKLTNETTNQAMPKLP